MVTNLSARERNDSQARFNVYPLETDNLCAITAPSNVSLFSFFLSLSPPLLKSVCISRYVVLVAIYNPFIVQICISDGEREGIKIFLVTDGIGLEKHLVASGVFPFPAMMSTFRS